MEKLIFRILRYWAIIATVLTHKGLSLLEQGTIPTITT